jgi:hypothetical protein
MLNENHALIFDFPEFKQLKAHHDEAVTTG